MAAKSKSQRKKKAAKADLQALAKLPEGLIKEKVEELLARGKPRDAIQLIQQSSHGDTPGIVFLKIVAYAMRARQLEEKGLTRESEALLEMLEKPPLAAVGLPCGELARAVRAAPFDAAVKWYGEHRKNHSPCPEVERAVADMFVFTGRWDGLERLSADDPVRVDGTLVVEALPDMDAARWEEGVAKLASLPRKSPFAGWKWFAKAMATACDGDGGSLDRSLKQLPDDFPLKTVVGALQKDGCAALKNTREWLARPIQAEADELVKAIKGREQKLPDSIKRFASVIFPHSPEEAVRPLAELAAIGLARANNDAGSLAKLLPPGVSRSILLRMEIFFPHQLRSADDRTPFCAALEYLNLIETDFPHVSHKQKVEAALYHRLLSILANEGAIRASELSYRDRTCLNRWLKRDGLKTEDTYFAIGEKITRLAPDVIVYYRTLGALRPAHASNEGKALFEKGMQAMLRQYPEDPFPYLRLARFYSDKGAYRKSEKILDDAWKQAPYDSGVKEEYVLSLLKAAMRSANRKSFQIAWSDVERAVGLESRTQTPLIHAVTVAVRYLEEGNPDQQLKVLLDLPEPPVALRSLVCFYGIVEMGRGYKPRNYSTQIEKKTRKLLEDRLKDLSGNELMEVVAPVPDAYHTLTGDVGIVGLFGSLWSKILEKLDDRQVLTVYALVLGEGYPKQIRQVKKDLKKRGERRKADIFLGFYEILADYALDQEPPSFAVARFDRLIKSLEPDDVMRLRNFCRDIARYFVSDRHLYNALNSFNFYELVDYLPWGEPLFPGPEEFDFDEDDFDLFDEPGGFGGTIDEMENALKDFNKLRGNKQVLKLFMEMLVRMVESQGVDNNGVRQLGILLEHEAGDAIRTLRELYSGDKKKELSKVGRLLLFPYE